MNKFLKITGISLLTIGLAACSVTKESANEQTEQSSDPTIQVLASFYPMYDFTRNVVGNEGNVELLMPAGTDSHDYEPSAKDMAKIQEADVFVYNNENMEMWVPAIESTLKEGDVTVVKATEGMVLLPGDEEHDHDHEHDHEEGHSHELDPHVWLAPSLAIKQVASIRDQLSRAYPEKKAAFERNAAAYLEKLQSLDDSYQSAFKNAKQTHFVEDTGIKTIYFEENAKDSIAKTLATEAGVDLSVLNPLEGLTQEQMDRGEDYISIMEQNRDALMLTTSQANEKEVKEAEKEKTVYNGYFDDADVQDRSLTDWKGQWQSVYPYLKDGTLDQVFDYKAKQNKSMTAEEYKDYYTTGYQTDVAEITITGDTMAFTFEDGTTKKATYQYVGKKILNYQAGNRGVRYLFESKDNDAAFKYIQFSDHSIAPTDSHHFHLYFGNESQEALLSEMDHWPTFYPTDLSGLEIAQEMLAH